MKWIATILVMLACGVGTMMGCEAREDMAPMSPAAPAEVMPDMEEPSTTAPAATSAPTTQASAALAIANQYCAVMSEHKIDATVTTVQDGKTIGFCCEDCIPTFKKEPAKYLASLK